jgi:diguanylate cyclase (GGDEF)-like protein
MQADYIEKIVKSIEPFQKMYNVIRLVDPKVNKVLYLKGNEPVEMESKCFEFWNKNEHCQNCVSIRAHLEKDTFVKIEYIKDNIYMITALPVNIGGREVVVELLKNVTSSIIIEDENFRSTPEVYTMIEAINAFALKDNLTNAYNRRYINETLTLDLISATLTEKPLCLIMADIDRFKEINDKYGHVAGDNVIKSFADILIDSISGHEGWVGRFGGEEFLCCLTNSTLEDAVQIAEKIRKRVEETTFYAGENKMSITASFGVYCAKPKVDTQASNLLDLVDKNLYNAKVKGRNRVEY